MKFQDWIWVYLSMGEAFTRWAILLFYGAFCALGFVVVALASVLAVAMALHR
jgi:hypothetical protein